MKIQAIKTARVTAGALTLEGLLDSALPVLNEGSVLAITSKVVSLCEGAVVPLDAIDKESLIRRESDRYAPDISKYGYHFTLKNSTLISAGGIDESNCGDNYVLWPADAQRTANEVRRYLCQRFGLEQVGVIIVDSTCMPLRRGTNGLCLAHSGFRALHDYVGQPDLFGRPFEVSQANIAGGLAAAAVLVMGEGTERTPLCIIDDVAFVEFQRRNPTAAELKNSYIPLEEDLFEPFLAAVPWQEGEGGYQRSL